MSVKSIFFTLFGTILVIVFGNLIVEMFNINVVGMQIKQNCTMASKQAANLYTQETYKIKGDSYSANMNDISLDGTVYITGKFYEGNDTSDIWNNIHESSVLKNFMNLTSGLSINADAGCKTAGKMTVYSLKDMVDTSSSKDTLFNYTGNNLRLAYKHLNSLYNSLYRKSELHTLRSRALNFDHEQGSVEDENKRIIKEVNTTLKVAEDMYTPVNIGVPYFDNKVINKMFRWNLVKLLSQSNTNNIKTETYENGQKVKYVQYSGFHCYVDDAYISNLDYYLFDTSNEDEALRLEQLTGLSAKYLRDKSNFKSKRENNIVSIVGIRYKIPITYYGITPLGKIFNYVWNKETRVVGVGDDKYTNIGELRYTYDKDELTNSSDSTNGLLPATGELFYVLVR